MNKKRINEIYQFMSNARMGRMTDEEKVTMIKTLRLLKPIATIIQEAAQDAFATAKAEYPDDQKKAVELVNKSMADVLNAEVDGIDLHVLTTEGFERLCLSNDWTFAQMDELEAELVRSGTNLPA